MFKKIKEKVKDSVEKIKQDIKDLELTQKQKEILKYLKEHAGISNLEMMSTDIGYLVSVIKHELVQLVDQDIIEGSFIFDETEFILHDHVKEHILDRIQDGFQFDYSKIPEEFGIPITVVREIINDLCSVGEIHGFFDIPENRIFFRVSQDEEKKFIDLLKEKTQKIKDLGNYIEDLILSHEDLDVDSLIEKIEDKPKQDEEDELLALAEEMAKENINEKRARIWIENLISRKKISGNFDKKLETFTSDQVFLLELFNEIQAAGRIGLYDIESRYGVTSNEKIKIYIELLEKNRGLKGFFSEDGEEYITEDKIISEIQQSIADQEEVLISSINIMLGLENDLLIDLINHLIKTGKLNGVLSKNNEKFYQIKKLNTEIMEILSENKEVSIPEIAKKFDISNSSAVSIIKKLLERYKKQLQGFITTDELLFIKEEPLNFKIMDFIENAPQNKIPLLSFQETLKLDEDSVIYLLEKMMEFGLISGKIHKNTYVKK